MKIAVAVGIAAALLIAIVVLLRRPTTSPSAAAPVVPPPASAASPAGPATSADPLPLTPAATPARADPRGLLAGLAKALRDNDEKNARALLNQLHELLYPPLPDNQNGALLYTMAWHVAREKMGGLHPKGLDNAIYSAVLTGKEITPAQAAELRAWFEKNGPAVSEVNALLCEAAQRPQCSFPDSSAAMQKAITNLSYSCNLLRMTALVEQQGGKSSDAAELALAGLGMAQNVRTSPNLISQLLGCSYDSLTLEGVRGTMDFSTPKIAAWLDAADPASVRDCYLRALLGHVDLILTQTFDGLDHPETIIDEAFRRKAQSQLFHQDMAAFVECMGDFSRFAGRPYFETRADIDALVRQHGDAAPWYASLSQEIIPALPGLSQAIAKSEAQMTMAKLSLELERYRAKNGGYPASLDALAVRPPPDPFTGQPFGYRKEGSGFVLESPGGAGGKDALLWRSR